MNKENKHTTRLALLLALMVVTLMVVSIDQLRVEDSAQEASALQVYEQR